MSPVRQGHRGPGPGWRGQLGPGVWQCARGLRGRDQVQPVDRQQHHPGDREVLDHDSGRVGIAQWESASVINALETNIFLVEQI